MHARTHTLTRTRVQAAAISAEILAAKVRSSEQLRQAGNHAFLSSECGSLVRITLSRIIHTLIRVICTLMRGIRALSRIICTLSRIIHTLIRVICTLMRIIRTLIRIIRTLIRVIPTLSRIIHTPLFALSVHLQHVAMPHCTASQRPKQGSPTSAPRLATNGARGAGRVWQFRTRVGE
jgi:hypothetical protein